MYRFWLLSVIIACDGPSFRALNLNCSGLIPFYGFMLFTFAFLTDPLCHSKTWNGVFISDSLKNLEHGLNKPPHGRWALF